MSRMRSLIAALVAGAALLAAGCGGSGGGSSLTANTIPDTASLAPAAAGLWVSVDTDRSSDQWTAVDAILAQIPGGENLIDDALAKLGSKDKKLDFQRDVQPALGKEVVVVVPAGAIRSRRAPEADGRGEAPGSAPGLVDAAGHRHGAGLDGPGPDTEGARRLPGGPRQGDAGRLERVRRGDERSSAGGDRPGLPGRQGARCRREESGRHRARCGKELVHRQERARWHRAAGHHVGRPATGARTARHGRVRGLGR